MARAASCSTYGDHLNQQLPSASEREALLRNARSEALAKAFKARIDLDEATEEIKRCDMALTFLKGLVDPTPENHDDDQ